MRPDDSIKRSACHAVWLALALAGCTPSPTPRDARQSSFTWTGETQVVVVRRTASGVITSKLEANSPFVQVMTVDGNTPMAGTALAFPPGSLAIPTEVVVEEGASVAVPSLQAAVGLTGNVAQSGIPVAVTSSAPSDPVAPFSIALNIPESHALLDTGSSYSIVYKAIRYADRAYLAGVIPSTAVTLSGGKVHFDASYFGIYQVVVTKTPVLEAKTVEVASPIQTKASIADLPPLQVSERTPLVVSAGQRVELRGKNFRPTMQIALGGTLIKDINVASDSSASFLVPIINQFGLTDLNVDQDGASQTATLVYRGGSADIPVITLPPSEVCAGQKYYDATGRQQTGAKPCYAQPPIPACASDGAVGCVTTTAFKAADTATLRSEDLREGKILGGLVGSLARCTEDGAVECIASEEYRATDMVRASAGNIKNGIVIAGVKGELKPDTQEPQCAHDGDQSCLAAGEFYAAKQCLTSGSSNCYLPAYQYLGSLLRAVDTSSIASEKMHKSLKIIDLEGTMQDCASNGVVGCVTNATFKAADLSNLVPGNIKAGVNVAGTEGSYPSASAPLASNTDLPDLTRVEADTEAKRYEFFDSTGQQHTIVVADPGTVNATSTEQTFSALNTFYRAFAIASVAQAPTACLSNGAQNCLVSGDFFAGKNCTADGNSGCYLPAYSGFKAAATSGLPDKVLKGKLVAGIEGNVTLPDAKFVLLNTDFGVSGTGSTGTLTLPNPENVRKTNGVFGVGGWETAPGLGDCTTDGSSGCVVAGAFKAANSGNILPGNIKKGVVIAGVTGQYPSASHSLDGATNTADLDLPTFDAKIKSASAFEWFDAAGNRYVREGDVDFSAENIASDVTIFNTTGTMARPQCRSTTETACTTDSACRWIPGITGIPGTCELNPWNIRAGIKIGDKDGALVFYKNMVNTNKFDRFSQLLTGAAYGADKYDTLDDYNKGENNNPIIPTQNPWGGSMIPPGGNWMRDSASDTDGNKNCNNSEACVYHDLITGLYWAVVESSPTTKSWESAISKCDSTTNYGTYSDWRLPTQKELLQAYVDGIWKLKNEISLNTTANDFYWSSTSMSDMASYNAWGVDLAKGSSSYQSKISSNYVICVR